LNVQATLKVEDGQRVVYAECMLGEKNLSINCKNMFVDVNLLDDVKIAIAGSLTLYG
jgi:hypothetical protein